MRLNLLFEHLSSNDPQHQEFYRFLRRFRSLTMQIYHHIYDKIEPKSNRVIVDLSPEGDSNWDSDDQVVVDLSQDDPKEFGANEANRWKFYLTHEMNLIPKLERALKIVNYLIEYEKENPHKIQDPKYQEASSLSLVEGAKPRIINVLAWLRSPTDKNITLKSFKDFLSNLYSAGAWVAQNSVGSGYSSVDVPRYPLNISWGADSEGNQVPIIGKDD